MEHWASDQHAVNIRFLAGAYVVVVVVVVVVAVIVSRKCQLWR